MKRVLPIVLVASAAYGAYGQCVPVPVPLDAYSGTNGGVYSSVVFDDGTGPALYLSGNFTLAGNTAAVGIVKWNGQEFVAMGIAAPTQSGGLAVDGDSLLAASNAGTAMLRRLRGGTWTSVGAAFATGSYINTIRVGSDGIYLGGRSLAGSGAVVLTASGWQPVGGGVTGEVFAIEQVGGRVFVGGNVTHVGGATGIDVNSIAQWDGTQWSAMGGGLDGAVRSISVLNNEVYAGGSFEASEGRAVTCIGRFDGTKWQEVGGGLEGPVYQLSQIDGNLVACGAFTKSHDTLLDHLAKFEGGQWKPVANGLNGDAWTLSQFGGKLHVGGVFTGADGSPALRIASLNNGHWKGLVSGADGAVSAMTKFNDRLIVSGSFSQIGGAPVQRMAAFDGANWSQFGNDPGFSANCFQEFEGQLLAGGGFSLPNGLSGVARFNGSSWDAMGALEGNVRGMHVHNGVLYAYGNGLLRQTPTGQPFYGLARWDGTNWVNGFPGATRSLAVTALETFNGRLYMAGDSTGTLVGVWDLSGAEPVPAAGSTSPRNALKVFNGLLYIGGGNPVVSVWNGTSTISVSAGPIQPSWATVEQFEVHSGRIFAIGWFPTGTTPTATTVLRIVDGPTPQATKTAVAAAMGSYQPTTAAQSFGSRLYVGGSFKFFGASAAATNSSAFLGSLACACAADYNNDNVVDTFDYLDFVQRFATGNVAADVNTDGIVDFFDYLDFVGAFSQGC